MLSNYYLTPKVMSRKKIDIGEVPNENVRDGLLIRFDRDLKFYTEFAYANINKGQRYYDFPVDSGGRKIVAVYKA